MPLTPADLDRIEQLARAATPGKRVVVEGGTSPAFATWFLYDDKTGDERHGLAHVFRAGDSEFLAALNPDTALALVEAARRGLEPAPSLTGIRADVLPLGAIMVNGRIVHPMVQATRITTCVISGAVYSAVGRHLQSRATAVHDHAARTVKPEDLGIAPYDEPRLPPEPSRRPARDPLRAVESAVATLVAESDRANGEHVALMETTRVLLAQHAAAVQLAESARAETRRAWGVAIVAGALLALALLR